MDEQAFWDLVRTIGRDPAGETFDRLADGLSEHGAADIRDFADHVARALYALDTPAHYRVAAECFLDARCAAVAAGATAYREVLRTPAALARFRNRRCARLVAVAGRAYETSTRGEWRHDPPVSHETGSNAEAWGVHWLQVHMGTTTLGGRAPQAYMVALQHVVVALDTEPAWQLWWRQSGVLECELGIVAEGRLDHLRPSADIRKVRGKVRATFTCVQPACDGHPAELFGVAVDELTGMFEVIREAMRLPPLPAVPPLPALSPKTRRLTVTTRPLPRSPAPDKQGYQTLAQIQEFFA
jgi:hypothetical protein